MKYTGSGTSKAGIPVRLHLFANGVEYIVNTSGTAWTTIRQDSNTVPNVWFNVDFFNGTTVEYYAEVDPNHIYPETNEIEQPVPVLRDEQCHLPATGHGRCRRLAHALSPVRLHRRASTPAAGL